MPLRLILPLVLAACLGLVLALAPGYPTSTQVEGGSRSRQLVHSLNAAIQSFGSELERLRLVGHCQLRLRPIGAAPIQVDLLSLSIRADADPDSGDLELYLGKEPEVKEVLLLATSHWSTWAAAQSDLQQLRGLCARSRVSSEPSATPAIGETDAGTGHARADDQRWIDN